MIVQFNLFDQNLEITFKEEIKSLVKIQLLTVHSFNNRNSSMLIFDKKFDFQDTLNLKQYLEENQYQIYLDETLQNLFENFYQEQKKLSEKINILNDLKNKFDEKDFTKYISSLSNVKRPLLKHQEKPSYHLYKAKCAANFSVPGSGKTSVVLSYYQKLKDENKIDAIFVIGPKVCFNSWNDEFTDTLGRDAKIHKLSDIKAKRKVFYFNHLNSELITCHFQLVPNDSSELIEFCKTNRLLLVIDEAHNIKKISGTWASAILALGQVCEHKVVLTGTPMPNQLRDFFNYLDFLYGNDKVLSDHDKRQIQIYEKNNQNKAIELLREKINPFFTRVTKKDLNLSKPNFNKPIFVEMNTVEKKIYTAILSRIRDFEEEKFLQNIDFINKLRKAKIIRLMQSCSYIKNFKLSLNEAELIEDIDFSDIDKEEIIIDDNIMEMIANYDRLEQPAKLKKLKEMVKNLAEKNKKVLIWSNHLKTISLIYSTLIDDGHFVKIIIGQTSEDERKNIKKEFNDKNSLLNVIVANPKACSESISLHKACNNAIYYDQNYNAAEFLQSLDRIHRVGGSEHTPVFYDFLQYENTIEQKIYKKLREKADRQMKVIESENLIFSPEETDDWEDLYNEITK